MLAVSAIGMVSSLGLGATASCAAARAGIQRITEIDDILVQDVDGQETAPIAVHRVTMASGFFGFARFKQLASAALLDLLGDRDLTTDRRLGVILVAGEFTHRKAWLRKALADQEVSEALDLETYQRSLTGVEERLRDDLLDSVLCDSGLDIRPELRKTILATTAGFLLAVNQAEGWLKAGTCTRCLIGCVDTLLDPTTLDALKNLRLLKTPKQPVGLIPGEAACFLLVESPGREAKDGSIEAILEGASMIAGPPHPLLDESPPGADPLAQSITATFSGSSDEGKFTGLIVANLNGDPHRATAFSDAIIRVVAPVKLVDSAQWYPPVHFGEIGTATAAVSIALLARGWSRGYAPSAHALVCLIDDSGARGSLAVRRNA